MCRISQKIYPRFTLLLEKEPQRSEIILKEMLIEDQTKGYDITVIQKLLQQSAVWSNDMPY